MMPAASSSSPYPVYVDMAIGFLCPNCRGEVAFINFILTDEFSGFPVSLNLTCRSCELTWTQSLASPN